MTNEADRQLLHYCLIEKLGEGEMGVAWKALDTTLDRQIAIKILPDAFERHPDRGERFLVMELVEGEDLSKRLARGPLPTIDALKLCSQVARTLQAAHDRNVVHRDLKPANIVLTASGEAKVLDYQRPRPNHITLGLAC